MIFRFREAKLGTKIDQQSIKKRKQKGKRFEHRFLIDLGEFWGPSWEAKWSPNRAKKASAGRRRHESASWVLPAQGGVLTRGYLKGALPGECCGNLSPWAVV